MKPNALRAILFLAFTFILLPFTCLFAQGTTAYTYIENFQNNINQWWVGNNNDAMAEIKDGRYILHKKSAGDWQVWSTTNITHNQSRDFQLDTAVKFLQGAENFGYGIAWGLRPGDNYSFYYFIVSANGQFTYGKYTDAKYSNIIPWKESPAVKKGQAVNVLRVVKSGNMLHLFINNTNVGAAPVEPFFGNTIGFHVGNQVMCEAYNLSVSYPTSEHMPAGWSIMHMGNFKSRVQFLSDKSNNYFMEMHKESDLAFKAPVVTGNNVSISTNIKTPQNTEGSFAGIYLQTEDGARLRLERVYTPENIKFRFTASSGGKEMGTKEMGIAHNVPSQDVSVTITRQGESFKGMVSVKGVHDAEIGSLKWPNLSQKQEVGIIASYRSTNPKAPASLNYEFSNLSISPQPAAVQIQPQQQVAERKPVPQTVASVINIAGTTWSGKYIPEDRSGSDYYFNADGILYYNRSKFGTWKQTGNSIYFEVNNGYAEYTGTISGTKMEGKAKNINKFEWTWSATKKD